MKIKTNYDGCPYITAGEEYELAKVGKYTGWIEDDFGGNRFIHISRCGHLHGRDWQVVQEERFSQEAAQEMYDFIKHVANGRSDYFGDAKKLLAKMEKNNE